MAAIAEKIGVGEKLQTKDGEKSTVDVLANKKVIGLYFSAHWCPPCRNFTPTLVEFYNSIKKDGKFEVIFISSDKSPDDFNGYYADMPWVAVSFTDRERKAKLCEKYGISGIPTLILLDSDGEKIDVDGRNDVTKGGDSIRTLCQ